MSGTESQRKEKLAEIYERAELINKELEGRFDYHTTLCYAIVLMSQWVITVCPPMKPAALLITRAFIDIDMAADQMDKEKDGLLSKPD